MNSYNEKRYADFTLQFYQNFLKARRKNFSHYVFLCVGSDRVTGDCFGPIVGEKLDGLLGRRYKNILVIGNLKEPLCSTNIKEKINMLNKISKNPYIITIDAAFSRKEDVGRIIVKEGGSLLGKGIHKQKDRIGNLSIKAIVAKDHQIPQINFTILQNIPLGFVMSMAEDTANGIYKVIG